MKMTARILPRLENQRRLLGNGLDIDPAGVEIPAEGETVPVHDSFDYRKHLGYATNFRLEDDELIADLEIRLSPGAEFPAGHFAPGVLVLEQSSPLVVSRSRLMEVGWLAHGSESARPEEIHQEDVMPEIRWLSESKIHRGFRDRSGLFTLEECRKSAAHVEEVAEGALVPESHEQCLNCYPELSSADA